MKRSGCRCRLSSKGCVNYHNCRSYTHLHDLRKETNHARHGKLQDVVSTEMFDHAHRKISAALNLVARHFCEDVHSAGGATAAVQEQPYARSLSGAPLTSSRPLLTMRSQHDCQSSALP